MFHFLVPGHGIQDLVKGKLSGLGGAVEGWEPQSFLWAGGDQQHVRDGPGAVGGAVPSVAGGWRILAVPGGQ